MFFVLNKPISLQKYPVLKLLIGILILGIVFLVIMGILLNSCEILPYKVCYLPWCKVVNANECNPGQACPAMYLPICIYKYQ